eukprot:CAMPEP_0118658478 /NCGR_PEP_ID=MMETSP0785-20121206/14591_1 /TAXON_ID=91992 /ORGANISM="Bolidomonas pacifica, Strain CCMP 1866" /LENGTH=104 /DNA_ID=CAMNT_0006551501 /DNA_START=101 /DNA_END=412 /DNA_ORIENTATION=+
MTSSSTSTSTQSTTTSEQEVTPLGSIQPHSRPSNMRVALENLLEDLEYPSQWRTDEEYQNIVNIVRSSNPTISSSFDPNTYTPTLTSKDGTYELLFNLCTSILT